MMKLAASFAVLASLVRFATAQSSPEWGQCGGIGWTGPTTCVAGTTCVVSNPYYSQCLPGSSPPPPPPPPTSQPGSPTTSSPGTTPTGGSGKLNAAAKAAGKLYFGSATDNSELSDAPYVAILKDSQQFGQITPANSMKWDATEPQRGTFTFTQGDQIANFAKQNGQLLRGHNCVWYNQLPSWVSNGGFNASTLSSIVSNHCGTVVGHYKGQAYAWDVINEAFNDDGTWRSDVFYNTLGTSFVATAFQAARAADPNAKLYINDYNIEQAGAKATAVSNLVKSLKSSNVPIDGVGLQSHFIVGELPSSYQSNIAAFAALGVEVAITELDIRMTLPASSANVAQQARDYQTVASACNAVKGCIGITVWDYTDKYSWVPSTFSGQGQACPWDSNLQPKTAVINGILAGL